MNIDISNRELFIISLYFEAFNLADFLSSCCSVHEQNVHCGSILLILSLFCFIFPGSESTVKVTELDSTCSLYTPARRDSVGAESAAQFGVLPSSNALRRTLPSSPVRATFEVDSPYC